MSKQTGIKVKLVGNDGNAFAILGTVTHAMRKAKVPEDTITTYIKEAAAGTYEQLLATTPEYVIVL
jgi:hypothetical protein